MHLIVKPLCKRQLLKNNPVIYSIKWIPDTVIYLLIPFQTSDIFSAHYLTTYSNFTHKWSNIRKINVFQMPISATSPLKASHFMLSLWDFKQERKNQKHFLSHIEDTWLNNMLKRYSNQDAKFSTNSDTWSTEHVQIWPVQLRIFLNSQCTQVMMPYAKAIITCTCTYG